MKKTSTHWVWLGYVLAFAFEVVNIVHNYLQYPDIDKFIAYSLLACCVFAISWMYDWLKKLSWQLEAVEENIQDRLE